MIFRCFTERFVIAVGTVDLAIAVVSWLLPTLLNPVAGLFRWAFLVLWGLAFLMSLNMPIQSVRHPYIELEKIETKAGNQRLLILGAVCAIALALGVLLYFIPLR